jgi:ankyrin repeat protein
LESGADSDVLDHDGKSYLSYLEEGEELNDYCITSNSTELTKDSTEEGQVILDHKFILGSQLLNSVTRSKLNEVKTLLDQGADIESKDKKGRTALQIAQENSDGDMVLPNLSKLVR